MSLRRPTGEKQRKEEKHFSAAEPVMGGRRPRPGSGRALLASAPRARARVPGDRPRSTALGPVAGPPAVSPHPRGWGRVPSSALGPFHSASGSVRACLCTRVSLWFEDTCLHTRMSVVWGHVHVHTCVVWDVCVHVFVVRACVHVCRLQACVFVHMLWFADMCACVHVWFEKPPSNSRLVPVLRTGPAWPPGPGWVARGGVWLRLPGHPSARTTAAEPGEAEGGSGRTVTVAPAPV